MKIHVMLSEISVAITKRWFWWQQLCLRSSGIFKSLSWLTNGIQVFFVRSDKDIGYFTNNSFLLFSFAVFATTKKFLLGSAGSLKLRVFLSMVYLTPSSCSDVWLLPMAVVSDRAGVVSVEPKVQGRKQDYRHWDYLRVGTNSCLRETALGHNDS